MGYASKYGRALSVLALAFVVALTVGCPGPQGPAGPQGPQGPEGPPGPSDFGGNAPGLHITIEKVTIPADLRPVVTFTAVDDRGDTLALNEFSDIRFIMGYLKTYVNGGTPKYFSYTTQTEDSELNSNTAVQATTDSARLNGLTQSDTGKFKYKFATAIPANYDPSASHQVAAQAVRNFAANDTNYPDNPWFAWVPDGSTPVETREIVNTETCNGCHTRLAMHGGNRREIQYCIMCHSPQSSDAGSGNTVDFAVMIHKIHRGENLPSVQEGDPYFIEGHNYNITPFSDVVFPQDIRHCYKCHGQEKALYYLEHPTMEGCGACHDRTWFGTAGTVPTGYTEHSAEDGTLDVDIDFVDDSLCSSCHTPQAPGVAPILDKHVAPLDSDDAPGLNFVINSITIQNQETAPQPLINFTVTDKNGVGYADISNELERCNMLVGWPTTDFEDYSNDSVLGSGDLTNLGNGNYTFLSPVIAPVGSEDTYAVVMTGRLPFIFSGDGQEYEEGPQNSEMKYFRVDGGDPVPRREVVAEDNCNVCHGKLALHGEQRIFPSCLICHNPNGTDEPFRPTTDMPPVSIHFKYMVHKIHTGEELEGAYTVIGYRGSVHDYTEVAFPGLRQECDICHVDDSYEVPLPEDALSTRVVQEYNGPTLISETPPTASACTSCHDGLAPIAHAYIMTSQGVESCEVCHEEDADHAVSKVHALGP